MRKVLVFLLAAVFCVSCIAPFGADAVVIETEETNDAGLVTASDYPLQYWYVDTGYNPYVGKWSKSQIKVYVESQSTWNALTEGNMKMYVRTAFSNWGLPSKSILFVTSAALADVEVYGITRDMATAKGIADEYGGLTEWGTSTWQSAIYVNNENVSEFKRLYQMSHCVVYLIEDNILGDNTTKYTRLATHELGHAFGYYGHYEQGSVMKSNITTVTTYYPSQNEKNHLQQLY